MTLHLSKFVITELVLLLKFVPVLNHHFKLFENHAVSESVPARIVNHEVIFVGVVLFHSSVQRNSNPEWGKIYQ